MSSSEYEDIEFLSKRFTLREREDLMLTLLRHTRDRYHLTNEDIEVIWKAAQETPTRCTWVRKDGVYRDTKCRNLCYNTDCPKTKDTIYCKCHLK